MKFSCLSSKKEDPRLNEFDTAARRQVDSLHDLVLVVGQRLDAFPVNENRMGLFLQERRRRDHFDYIGSEGGISSFCPIQLKRVTAQDVVYFCESEDGYGAPTGHYLLYDIQSKRLIRQAKFTPFLWAEDVVARESGHPVFLMENADTVVAVGIDPAGAWRIESSPPPMSLGEFMPLRLARIYASFGPNKAFRLELRSAGQGRNGYDALTETNGGEVRRYLLPQSTFAKYKSLHPEDTGSEGEWEGRRDELMGPYQVVGSRIWFGKSYDVDPGGVGHAGVGAFGYFDMEKREWTLHSPPEVAGKSITAISVEREAVWLGLCSYVGDLPGCGGIVRWDRTTHKVRETPFEGTVTGIARQGESLYLATGEGLAIVRGGKVRRFIISIGKSGGYEVVPVLEN